MADEDWTAQAEQIVTLIRSQNWKNGVVLSVDHGEAVALVAQALATAYSGGQVDAAKETGDSMLRAFDKANFELPKPTPDQEAYLRRIQEYQAKGYDPTVMVGGPDTCRQS